MKLIDKIKKKNKNLSLLEKKKYQDKLMDVIECNNVFFESLKNKDFCKKARTYLSDKNFNDEFKPAQKRGW